MIHGEVGLPGCMVDTSYMQYAYDGIWDHVRVTVVFTSTSCVCSLSGTPSSGGLCMMSGMGSFHAGLIYGSVHISFILCLEIR